MTLRNIAFGLGEESEPAFGGYEAAIEALAPNRRPVLHTPGLVYINEYGRAVRIVVAGPGGDSGPDLLVEDIETGALSPFYGGRGWTLLEDYIPPPETPGYTGTDAPIYGEIVAGYAPGIFDGAETYYPAGAVAPTAAPAPAPEHHQARFVPLPPVPEPYSAPAPTAAPAPAPAPAPVTLPAPIAAVLPTPAPTPAPLFYPAVQPWTGGGGGGNLNPPQFIAAGEAAEYEPGEGPAPGLSAGKILAGLALLATLAQ